LLNTSRSIEIYQELAKILRALPLDWFNWPSKKDESSLLKLGQRINESINDEVGASLEKGNLIREGFSKDRDHLANMDGDILAKFDKMEKKYRDQTGILKLRIKSNNVFGYFIEVPKAQSKNLKRNRKRFLILLPEDRP